MVPAVFTALPGLLQKVTWAGHGLFPCDEPCKQRCVQHLPRAISASGHIMSDFQMCTAACGCGGMGFDHLFVQTDATTYQSTDAGRSWLELSTVIGRAAGTALDIEVSVYKPDFIVAWVPNEPLAMVTRDGGNAWLTTKVSVQGAIARWVWHPQRPWAFAVLRDPSQLCVTTDTITWLCDHTDPIRDAWWHGAARVGYTSTTTESAFYGTQVTVYVRSVHGGAIPLAGTAATGLPIAHEVRFVAEDTLVAVAENADGLLRLWVYQREHWALTTGGERIFDESLLNIEVISVAPHLLHIFVPAIGGFGHVWILDMYSLEVQRCLTYVAMSGEKAEWQNVDAVSGVFIANRLIFQQHDLDAFGPTTLIPRAGISVPPKGMRTVQSFDSGAVWSSLEAPQCRRSVSTCVKKNLHLHLHAWVTCAAAPGIVLAVGSEAPFLPLSRSYEGKAVFISRDAGLVWTRILERHWKVTLLGRGDIIVAAGSSIHVSTDHGRNWHSAFLTTARRAEYVQAIATHPSHLGFLALVITVNSTGTHIVPMDFAPTLERHCRGQHKLTAESDYERWSPADMLEDAHPTTRHVCFQGVRTSFVRRKTDRQCRSHVDEFGKMERPCECTMEDFRCSPGYIRDHEGINSKCVPIDPLTVSVECATFWVSSVVIPPAYTKIPGNRCDGGIGFHPARITCARNRGVLLGSFCLASVALYLFFVRWKLECQLLGSNGLRSQINDEELDYLLD